MLKNKYYVERKKARRESKQARKKEKERKKGESSRPQGGQGPGGGAGPAGRLTLLWWLRQVPGSYFKLFPSPPLAFSGCMSEPVLWKTRQRK